MREREPRSTENGEIELTPHADRPFEGAAVVIWRSRPTAVLVAILFGGVLLRLGAIAAGPGYPGDLSFFQEWSARMANGGPGQFYRVDEVGTYPPGLLYLLWPLGAWPGGVPAVVIRALSIPFDLAITLIVFALVRRVEAPGPALAAAAAYALNPALALAGPFWGQVNAIAEFPLLLALAAAARGRHIWAGGFAAAAAMIKPQTAVGLAVLLVAGAAVAMKRRDPRPLVATGASALLTAVALAVPFALTPEAIAMIARGATTSFSSIFAFNIWAIAVGFLVRDDVRWLSLPIWSWGLAFFAAALAILARRLWVLVPRERLAASFERDLAVLLAFGTLFGLALYELPTRMHESYLFPVFALLVPFVVRSRVAGAAYVVFSLVFATSLLFAFTHQRQTGVVADPFIERTLFDPAGIILAVFASLGATVALAAMWLTRRPQLGEPRVA